VLTVGTQFITSQNCQNDPKKATMNLFGVVIVNCYGA